MDLTLYYKFQDACISGNAKIAKECLTQQPELIKYCNIHELLYKAVENDNTRVVEFLLEQGANPNIQSGILKKTPLGIATLNDNFFIVKELIKYNANVNIPSMLFGATPLEIAVTNGNYEIAELLLANKANPNAYDLMFGTTVLQNAINENDLRMVKLLLNNQFNNHPDVNFKAHFFTLSPLENAIEHGNGEIVAMLLAHGANVNPYSLSNYTPLHRAIDKENNKLYDINSVIESILDENDNIDDYDDDTLENTNCDDTINSCEENSIIKMLINKGANVNANIIITHETPLSLSMFYDNMEIAKLLIKTGANVNHQSGIIFNRSSLLKIATEDYQREMQMLLIQNGANIDITVKNDDSIECNLLQSAVLNNDYKITELLLKKGANPNAFNSFKNKPAILYAIAKNNPHILELLLNNEANPNITYPGDYKPIIYSILQQSPHMVKSLIQHGATIDHYSIIFGSTLKLTHELHNLTIGKLIVPKSKDTDEYLANGINEKNTDAVAFLLCCGANLNDKHLNELSKKPEFNKEITLIFNDYLHFEQQLRAEQRAQTQTEQNYTPKL